MNPEHLALDVLVALALRQEELSDAEIADHLIQPVTLSESDKEAIRRCPSHLLTALRRELAPEARRLAAQPESLVSVQ